MSEHARLERKATVDLDDSKERLEFVLECVAMANAGGGEIHIGTNDDGTHVGIDAALAGKFDPARVGTLVESFIVPDRLELVVTQQTVAHDRVVVTITVPPAAQPPIVLCKVGNHTDRNGKQQCIFREHSVYVRRNTKAEPARREDFRRWIDAAVERAQNRILQNLALAVEAGPTATLRVIDDDEVRDAPNFLVSRTTELFKQNNSRLLSGDELAQLWLSRKTLELTPDAEELIFHSALRKRATLFLWLADLNLTPERIQTLLQRSLSLSDRDKSDAARSILQVAALYLDDAGYALVRDELAASPYKHMRDAADEYPNRDIALQPVGPGRAGRVTGLDLAGLTISELEATAESCLRGPTRTQRAVPAIGCEYLHRSQDLPIHPSSDR